MRTHNKQVLQNLHLAELTKMIIEIQKSNENMIEKLASNGHYLDHCLIASYAKNSIALIAHISNQANS